MFVLSYRNQFSHLFEKIGCIQSPPTFGWVAELVTIHPFLELPMDLQRVYEKEITGKDDLERVLCDIRHEITISLIKRQPVFVELWKYPEYPPIPIVVASKQTEYTI